MREQTIHDMVVMTVIPCNSCGISFAIPEIVRQNRAENGGGFYCPNGHWLTYNETELSKAKRERDEALRKATEAKCDAMRERSQRELSDKKLLAAQKRTKNGVCPCCHRSFQNLRRHIATKHPAFP